MPEVTFDGISCALCLTCWLWWTSLYYLKVLHYYIFFCLYMYTFVFCTLTASGTIVFSIFCESCLSLFSWFNKLVVSKARVGVRGLSVSSSHYAPFGNNRTEVNQTLLTFYFWNPARWIRTVVVYLLMILIGLSWIFLCFLFYSSCKNFLSQKSL